MAEETNNTWPKEINLSGGRKAVIDQFKGKHVMKAQKFAGTDSEKLLPHIMTQVVTIEGAPVMIEDLELMDGGDYFKLMGVFGESFM